MMPLPFDQARVTRARDHVTALWHEAISDGALDNAQRYARLAGAIDTISQMLFTLESQLRAIELRARVKVKSQ